MKIRIIWHSFKESFHNFLTHPLVTVASITTMTLMLTLLGSFILFSANIKNMVENISKQPPIEVYAKLSATESDIKEIESVIKNYQGVYSVESITPEENLAKFRENIGDKDGTFKYFNVKNIPHSFIVRLQNPEQSKAFQNKLMAHPAVYMVDFSQSVMTFLTRTNQWVQLITLIVMIILALICFFVISNMVRISVFSRGEEIQIMKYVGATNTYIRFPYVLEGAFVGILGAILSSTILYIIYQRIYTILSVNSTADDFFALRYDPQLAILLIAVLAGLGIGVGMLASGFSVRRHIRV